MPSSCQARRIWVSELKPASAAAWDTFRPACHPAEAVASRRRRKYSSGVMPAWSANKRARWRAEVGATAAISGTVHRFCGA